MKKKINVLWVGPVLSETQFKNRAVSAAASIWQYSFINELKKLDFDFTILTHLPHRVFPFGPPFVFEKKNIFPGQLNGVNFGYINIPFIREISLYFQYRRTIRKLSSFKKIDLIFTYNLESYITKVVLGIRKKRKPAWISIVADMPAVKSKLYFDKSHVINADGRLYLSWKNYSNRLEGDNALFFEGGVLPSVSRYSAPDFSDKKFRVGYFGSLTTVGGVDLFVEAIQKIAGDDYEFHIIGNGSDEVIRRIVSADPRIFYHGAASQAVLIGIGGKIDLFVDPRPLAYSENNFPSKLLTYLSFGVPVISTMGLGLSPEYKEVLIPLKSGSSVELASLIQQVSTWSPERRSQLKSCIEYFVLNKKGWPSQVKKFTEWVVKSGIS